MFGGLYHARRKEHLAALMRCVMKSFLPIVCLASSLAFSVPALGQHNERDHRWHSYDPVAHSTTAVDYKQGSTSKVELRGTSLMPDLKGEAEVKTKTGRAEVEAK